MGIYLEILDQIRCPKMIERLLGKIDHEVRSPFYYLGFANAKCLKRQPASNRKPEKSNSSRLERHSLSRNAFVLLTICINERG